MNERIDAHDAQDWQIHQTLKQAALRYSNTIQSYRVGGMGSYWSLRILSERNSRAAE